MGSFFSNSIQKNVFYYITKSTLVRIYKKKPNVLRNPNKYKFIYLEKPFPIYKNYRVIY